MKPLWAVQYMDGFPGDGRKQDADESLAWHATQDGYLGGRVIPPAGKGWWEKGEPAPVWMVQAFYQDCGRENADRLPDGCRRVMIPHTLFGTLGVKG